MTRDDPTQGLDIALRPLTSAAADEIVRVHRASFPSAVLERTIFSCHGVGAYLRYLTACPAIAQQDKFIGAFCQERLVGYAHLKSRSTDLHLNQIVVHPEFQGQAIGTRLLNRCKEEAARKGLGVMSLNVEQENNVALEWYLRLGFKERSRHLVYVLRDIPAQPKHATPHFSFVNWASAEALQQVFGFSELTVAAGRRRWTVGRIGHRWLRVAWPVPIWLVRELAVAFPERTVLITAPGSVRILSLRLVAAVLAMELRLS